MELIKIFIIKTLGLELINESEKYTFFKIADRYKGHNQTLALFAKTNLNAFGEGFSDMKKDHSTLHHFALEIDKEDYANVLNFCSAYNIEYVTEVF